MFNFLFFGLRLELRGTGKRFFVYFRGNDLVELVRLLLKLANSYFEMVFNIILC